LVTFSERIIPKFTQKFTQIIKPAVSRWRADDTQERHPMTSGWQAGNTSYELASNGRKIDQMVVKQTGWPDWAIFRRLGDCLVWAVFWKLN
jgi:hypothetical protein